MRTVFSLLIALAVSLLFANALPCPAADSTSPAFDKAPEPVGGMTALMHAVKYPKAAVEEGIEGKVLVSVVIDATGHVTSAEVTQGVRGDLDKAAVKALENSRWIAAQKDGRPVESKVIVPIQFKLEDKVKK